MKPIWQKNILDLIRQTSSQLPADVVQALERARRRETRGTSARWVLDVIMDNITLARQRGAPLCQDTGTLTFYCQVPATFNNQPLIQAIHSAVRESTRLGYLRQNTIDTLSGQNCASNLGTGMPIIHFTQSPRKVIAIHLLMKGGGSENVGQQYSLPDARIQAGRDWDGVQRCALDAVWQAQGRGCAPGVLGIGVGGDRASSMALAKTQFLRSLNDIAPDKEVAKLEQKILRAANELGIGPMGLGGKTTLLGVKVGVQCRLPASYFVSVAYMCWAFRRGQLNRACPKTCVFLNNI